MKNQTIFWIGFVALNIFVACDQSSDLETVTEDEVLVKIIETDGIDNHDAIEDYSWNATDIVFIDLNGNSITINGTGASATGSVLTITSSGTYSLSGNLSDGQIIVDTEDEEIVRLIFNAVDINCSSNAPIYVQSAEKTMIVLAEGTENSISDGSTYISSEEDANAAIFSKDPLTIYGDGQLNVDANYNDGITSRDGLIIGNATIKVDAKDDGIRGKDYLIIKSGTFTITAEGDGLLSDNEADAAKGFILIADGLFDITADDEAIQAETDVIIYDGDITLTSDGGKGIKSTADLLIHAGTITIDAAEDALYSSADLSIFNGTINLAAGNDGIHAEADIIIDNGTIEIIKSIEGIESYVGNITINSGDIHITSSDDGINIAAGGEDGSGSNTANYSLIINDGYIAINANGDGIDSNGDILIAGGVVIVSGSRANINSAVDFDGSFLTNGGLLIATGTAEMAKAADSASSQYSVLINFNSTKQAGTMVHIQNTAGDNLLTFEPLKSYQSVVFSSAALKKDSSYSIYYGGSSSGAYNDGLYTGGVYAPGSFFTSFTISSISTSVN